MRKLSLAVVLILVGVGLLSARGTTLPSIQAPQAPAPPAPVGTAGTVVTLTPSQDPEAASGTATLTARVALVSPGPFTPTGTVEFFDNDVSLGTASLSTDDFIATLSPTSLSGGPHTFSARYLGDSNCATGQSAVVMFVVIG